MKVELIIDESLDESLVKIYAPSYNEDIENTGGRYEKNDESSKHSE